MALVHSWRGLRNRCFNLSTIASLSYLHKLSVVRIFPISFVHSEKAPLGKALILHMILQGYYPLPQFQNSMIKFLLKNLAC